MSALAADEDEPPSMLHRRNVGGLDVHPSQNAVIVHYEAEALILSEYGEPMVAANECTKIINIKGLSQGTNVSLLAREVVVQCDLIDPTRVAEVEQLLLFLKTRKLSKPGFEDKDVLESSSRHLQQQMEDLDMPGEQASLADLDSYLEMLYEDLPSKVSGSGMILQLARKADNLIELASSDSLFQVMARVLRDDRKKSIELTTNIVYAFFCFSTFSNFHKILAKHKVGSTTLSVLEYELERHTSVTKDLVRKRKELRSGSATTKDYERSKKKLLLVVKKQETLLRVSLYLLLNIAEDTRVEFKMRSRGLIPLLLPHLERTNTELLILVISFLKKLSIFRENKDEMAAGGTLKKLVRVLPSDNEILVNVTLRLIFNLTFDPALREEAVRVGLLPKLVALLSNESHRPVVLKILYHISMEDKTRSMFAYADCIPQVMKLIVGCSDVLVDQETVSLAVNLALDPRSAQLMCKGPGLKLLMRRALQTQDSLLMKVLRNISQHPGPTKKLFLAYITELGKLVKGEEEEEQEEGEEECAVEALGILANLTLPEVDFERVMSELSLLPFIVGALKDHAVKEDILLEVVMLCGTLSLDEKCAATLVAASIPALFTTLLKAKQEDDELVLQIVYVFYQLVLHDSTRQVIISESQAPAYLLELMNDKNKEIGKLSSNVLDVIAEYDADLARKIQHERFRWHNFQWLELMTGEALYQEEDDEEDEDYLDLHMADELYADPDLYYQLQGELEGSHDGVGSVYARMGDGGRLGFEANPAHPVAKMDFFPASSIQANEDARYGSVGVDSDAGMGMGLEFGEVDCFYENDAEFSVHPTSFDTRGAQPSTKRVLSPEQYAMLLNSMEDPLAMYTSTLSRPQEEGPFEQGGRNSTQGPGGQRVHARIPGSDFDPLGVYGGLGSAVSPYGDRMDRFTYPAVLGSDLTPSAPSSSPVRPLTRQS